MANYCKGEVGGGPDGGGHPSDWQGGRAPRDTQSEEVHCIVKGMSKGNLYSSITDRAQNRQ